MPVHVFTRILRLSLFLTPGVARQSCWCNQVWVLQRLRDTAFIGCRFTCVMPMRVKLVEFSYFSRCRPLFLKIHFFFQVVVDISQYKVK
jgi:hypothetical protein